MIKYKNRNFFLFSQFIALLGERVTTIAFISIASEITVGLSFRSTSLIAAFQILPVIFFSFYGGYLADRFERKQFLLILNIIRVGIIITFLIIFNEFSHSISLIYLAVFCLGTLTSLYNPAKKSFIPFLVPQNDDEIKKGNWMLIISEISATLAGIAIGTVLLNFLPAQRLLVLDVSSFIIAIVTLLLMSTKKDYSSFTSPNQWTEFKKTLKLIREEKNIKSLMFLLVLPFYLSAGLFYSATSHWAALISPTNAGEAVGQLFLCISIGAIFSYFLKSFFEKGTEFYNIRILFLFLSAVVFLLQYSNINRIEFTYILGFFCGIFIGLLYTRSIYLFQFIVGKNIIGRITSINEIIFSVSFVFIIQASVLAGQNFTYQLVWLVTSIFLFLTFLINYILRKRIFFLP